MEQNPESALAWQFIESTGTHLFLTGKAGTGKTTFLRKLKQESPKRMVVVAPTGIAAINAGGVTIHSFFQIPFAPYVPESSFSTNGKASYRFRFGKEKINIIRSMDLLVIDEISMVRADLLAYPQQPKQFDRPVRLLDDTAASYFVAQSGLVSNAGKAPDHQAEFTAAQTRYELAAGQDEMWRDRSSGNPVSSRCRFVL